MKIGMVTSIPLGQENRQQPSFLINYYYYTLLDKNKVSLITTSNTKLNKLGVYLKKISCENLSSFDAILVYPSSSLGALPISIIRSKKIFVLGPDSAKLLFSRFIKNPNLNKLKRIQYLFLKFYFGFYERLASKFVKFLVVGKIDSTMIPGSYYIKHPFNLNRQIEHPTNREKVKDTIVMFGDLSQKYTLSLVEIANIIKGLEDHYAFKKVLIIGKSGTWIQKALTANGFNCTLIDWVDELETFLGELNAVHLFPLLAGAGTKNRVQLSIRLRAPIVGTSVALENIGLPNLSREELGISYVHEIGTVVKLHENCVDRLEDKLRAFNNSIDKKLLGVING